MATVTQFFVTCIPTYVGGNNANPIQAISWQVVTPWGKSSQRATLREAWYDVMDRTGGQQGGVQGNYMLSQTTNGLTTQSGQVTPLNANEVGIP
jgi:hypothetical protein